MLLMAVTLAFGMSSCSSDDDDDEPLPDDGWGQVDDEDEPSGGEEQLTEDALTGYWTRRSAVDGEKEAVRFTPDGIIAYEYSKDDGWDEVSVIAQGNYFVEGGRIRAVYLDIHVDTPYGDDVYGDFDENAICEIFYDAAIYRNGMSHSLILGNSLGGGKAFEKYESEDNGIRVTFDAYQYIQDNRANLVKELFSRSVIRYKGDSASTSDKSPSNVEKVDRILLAAIYDSYPKNIAPDDLDGAMVHVIQACDNERRKVMISEYTDFEEFFKAYPYGWSDHLIRRTWETALKEEIIIECDIE